MISSTSSGYYFVVSGMVFGLLFGLLIGLIGHHFGSVASILFFYFDFQLSFAGFHIVFALAHFNIE